MQDLFYRRAQNTAGAPALHRNCRVVRMRFPVPARCVVHPFAGRAFVVVLDSRRRLRGRWLFQCAPDKQTDCLGTVLYLIRVPIPINAAQFRRMDAEEYFCHIFNISYILDIPDIRYVFRTTSYPPCCGTVGIATGPPMASNSPHGAPQSS